MISRYSEFNMRGRSPFGNPLLWIVAAFVLPEVVKKCKPFAKVVGDTLVGAGEVFRKAAEETPKQEAAPANAENPASAEVAPESAPADSAEHTEPTEVVEPSSAHGEPGPESA